MTNLVTFLAVRKIPGAKISAAVGDQDWVLRHTFRHRDDPKLFETLAKIRAAGKIDLTNWRPASKGEC